MSLCNYFCPVITNILTPILPFLTRSVGRPVCHNFLKWRVVSLPCFLRSTCYYIILLYLQRCSEKYPSCVRNQGYIFCPFPPPPGGGWNFVQIENREEFEGGLHKKRKEKGEKRRKKKSYKTHVKIPLWSLNDRKKIHENREEI